MQPGPSQRRITKAEAAEQLTALLCRGGVYVTPGVITEMFDNHWSKLTVLAHAIHDDWKPEQTPYDNPYQSQL